MEPASISLVMPPFLILIVPLSVIAAVLVLFVAPFTSPSPGVILVTVPGLLVNGSQVPAYVNALPLFVALFSPNDSEALAILFPSLLSVITNLSPFPIVTSVVYKAPPLVILPCVCSYVAAPPEAPIFVMPATVELASWSVYKVQVFAAVFFK